LSNSLNDVLGRQFLGMACRFGRRISRQPNHHFAAAAIGNGGDFPSQLQPAEVGKIKRADYFGAGFRGVRERIASGGADSSRSRSFVE
jgi:hypothetical protein